MAIRTGPNTLADSTKRHEEAVRHSSVDPNWRTPPELFAVLSDEWTFELDAAADETNHLVDTWYGPGSPYAENALVVGWRDGPVFVNPPYSRQRLRETSDPAMDIANWAAKCWLESRRGVVVVGVFPDSRQTDWYRRYVMGQQTLEDGTVGWAGHAASRIMQVAHRVSFLRANGEPAENAGGNTVVVVWEPAWGKVGPWQPWPVYWSYR